MKHGDVMKWGYKVEQGRKPLPINLDITTYCHALLTGSSGSGKSYALLFLIGNLLKDTESIDFYFLDFKNSDDFKFLQGYPKYYVGSDCYTGVMKYYEQFSSDRETGHNKKRHILIFDEMPAFLNYQSTLDKANKTKKANDVLSAISEILMLGRGIGYGLWCVVQRPDSTFFQNGARENFMLVCGLGRISREQKAMIFTGEDLPDKVYQKGEGVLLADGYPLIEVKFPKIANVVDWKKHIKEILLNHQEKNKVQ